MAHHLTKEEFHTIMKTQLDKVLEIIKSSSSITDEEKTATELSKKNILTSISTGSCSIDDLGQMISDFHEETCPLIGSDFVGEKARQLELALRDILVSFNNFVDPNNEFDDDSDDSNQESDDETDDEFEFDNDINEFFFIPPNN